MWHSFCVGIKKLICVRGRNFSIETFHLEDSDSRKPGRNY